MKNVHDKTIKYKLECVCFCALYRHTPSKMCEKMTNEMSWIDVSVSSCFVTVSKYQWARSTDIFFSLTSLQLAEMWLILSTRVSWGKVCLTCAFWHGPVTLHGHLLVAAGRSTRGQQNNTGVFKATLLFTSCLLILHLSEKITCPTSHLSGRYCKFEWQGSKQLEQQYHLLHGVYLSGRNSGNYSCIFICFKKRNTD